MIAYILSMCYSYQHDFHKLTILQIKSSLISLLNDSNYVSPLKKAHNMKMTRFHQRLRQQVKTPGLNTPLQCMYLQRSTVAATAGRKYSWSPEALIISALSRQRTHTKTTKACSLFSYKGRGSRRGNICRLCPHEDTCSETVSNGRLIAVHLRGLVVLFN